LRGATLDLAQNVGECGDAAKPDACAIRREVGQRFFEAIKKRGGRTGKVRRPMFLKVQLSLRAFR
jgi:hypothetical protein